MELKELEAAVESMTREKLALESMVKDLDARCKAYEDLGSPEQITVVFDRMEDFMTNMEELGSIDQIREAFEIADKAIDAYLVLGRPEDIKKELDEYRESLDKSEAEKLSKEFRFSVDTIRDMKKNYESYDAVRDQLSKLMSSKAPKAPEFPDKESKAQKVTSRLGKLAQGM